MFKIRTVTWFLRENLRDHFPKSIRHLGRAEFDLVINMSGSDLPAIAGARIAEWDVPDPICKSYQGHCEVRDQIETLVMRLILDLRARPIRKP